MHPWLMALTICATLLGITVLFFSITRILLLLRESEVARLPAASEADVTFANNCEAAQVRLRNDPRLRDIPWTDLLSLRRHEIAHELTLSLPWLLASLAAAQWRLYPLALLASFMFFLTGLRQVHNAYHYALGVPRAATEWVMLALSVLMLGSMHAVQVNHLRHHRYCLGEEDIEAMSARLPAWRALLLGTLVSASPAPRGAPGRQPEAAPLDRGRAACQCGVDRARIRGVRVSGTRVPRHGHGAWTMPDRVLRRMDRTPRLRGRGVPRAYDPQSLEGAVDLRDVLPRRASSLSDRSHPPLGDPRAASRPRRAGSGRAEGLLAIVRKESDVVKRSAAKLD